MKVNKLFPVWALIIGFLVYYLFPYINQKYLASLPIWLALYIFIVVIDLILVIFPIIKFDKNTGDYIIFGRKL